MRFGKKKINFEVLLLICKEKKKGDLPLQDGTLALQMPSLHVKVAVPNRSKPVKQVKFAWEP